MSRGGAIRVRRSVGDATAGFSAGGSGRATRGGAGGAAVCTGGANR
jgi:hypothetical protein